MRRRLRVPRQWFATRQFPANQVPPEQYLINYPPNQPPQYPPQLPPGPPSGYNPFNPYPGFDPNQDYVTWLPGRQSPRFLLIAFVTVLVLLCSCCAFAGGVVSGIELTAFLPAPAPTPVRSQPPPNRNPTEVPTEPAQDQNQDVPTDVPQDQQGVPTDEPTPSSFNLHISYNRNAEG